MLCCSSGIDVLSSWVAVTAFGLVDGCGMLQMQCCSVNRHLLEEVKEREKGAEAQLERRKKLLNDSNMDADLKRLAHQSSELAAKASALRKVSIQAFICLQIIALSRPHYCIDWC